MKIKLLDKTEESVFPKKSHKLLRLTDFNSDYENNDRGFIYSKIALPSISNYHHELLISDSPVKYEKNGNIEVAYSSDYSVIRIAEHEIDPKTLKKEAEIRSSLNKAGYDAYSQLFEFLKCNNLGNLIRIWNYIPKILSDIDENINKNDRERYRQFNEGRHSAWKEHGPKNKNDEPDYVAATGIGTFGGPLVIECLVSNNDVEHIDNPRQTAPPNYPKKYGTTAPMFARASISYSEKDWQLFLSGTASIVGSETTHIGDPVEQTKETFENIRTLISNGNLKKYGFRGLELSDFQSFRIYVKNKRDLIKIKETVESIIDGTPVIYLNDDICRKDLLMEVEGITKLIKK